MKNAARKSVSRPRTNVRKLKSKIKDNPVPQNAMKRGKVGKKRRRVKEREMGDEMTTVGQVRDLRGAIMDPRGPKIDKNALRSKSLFSSNAKSQKVGELTIHR